MIIQKLKKIVFLGIGCMLLHISVYAQYVSWGNDKGNTKWQQIITENFQLIFPQGTDSVANVFANQLEYVYEYVAKSLGHKPAKISVLLHNQSTISNGFVTWAPKRMEIFDVPAQDQIAENWFEMLAIHEFRHVVQTDMMNRGVTQLLYFLLGQQAMGAVLGLYVPLWYLEGDAVGIETALSNSGRGRQATFSMGLRSQLIQDVRYSYDKSYFGSYKDYVPNYYEMGYFFVSGVRSTYSQDVWKKTLQRVADKPLSFTPFNKALKLETGYSKVKLFKKTFDYQQNLWKLAYSREGHTPFDTLTPISKKYTQYMFAQRVSDSVIIAQKSGFRDIATFVKITPNGKETKLGNVGTKPLNEPFSATPRFLVWAEEKPHVRWELANTSVIYVHSFSSNKTEKITTNMRVFAPALSPDETTIVAVHVDEQSTYTLVFFNRETKQYISSISIPHNEFPQTPQWNENGTSVVFTTTSSKGKRILVYTIESQSFHEILSYTFDDIANPVFWNDYVLFSSSYSGVDNIYALHTTNKNIYRITSSSFGSKYPSVFRNQLLFSDYSIQGFIIGETDLFIPAWYALESIKKEQYDLARTLQIQENGPINFDKMELQLYESKKYRKLPRLLNIHSWMPFYLAYNSGDISDQGLGFQILSQNILSTMQLSAGYRHTKGNAEQVYFVNATYTGFFPVLSTEFSHGYQTIYDEPIGVTNFDYTKTPAADYLINHSVSSVNIPLNFSSRAYSRYLNIGTNFQFYSYNKVQERPDTVTSRFPLSGQNNVISYSIQFTNQRHSVARDLGPRWAQVFTIGYTHGLFDSKHAYYYNSVILRDIVNHSVFGTAKFYFPGILYHHSLRLFANYKWNNDITNHIVSYDVNTKPRGYTGPSFNYTQSYSIQTTYAFPLLYPDISIGPLCYIKRFRIYLFADFAANLDSQNFMFFTHNDFNSSINGLYTYGFEFISDMHILRTLPEFSLGFRYANVQQTQKNSIEFVMRFDI